MLPDPTVAAAIHAKPPTERRGPPSGPAACRSRDTWRHDRQRAGGPRGWWIDGFTDGADPEYAEQILPLARRSWPAPGVLDVGCGDGQISRLAATPDGVERRCRHRPDVEPDHVAADAERAARRASPRRGADRLPFADARSTPSSPASCSSTSTTVDEAIAEVARVLAPGGRFCFFLNHPLLQTPGSGWIDDQVLDPPEQYWRIGPYLVEAVTIEEVELGVHIRFIHRPLSRYVNALADHGLLLERMVEPAPPPGSSPWRPSTATAATSRGCCTSAPRRSARSRPAA